MFRFLALGKIDLFHEDGRRAGSVLTQSKRLALLAYLLLENPGGRHRRDRLLCMFWPELDESRARHALSQSLHVLRRALGTGVIRRSGDDEVGVDPSRVECDALALRAAVAAGDGERVLALYGGELLPGLQVSSAPDFERWVSAERERLRRSAAEAARGLASVAAREGEHARAVSAARRLLEIAPHDEEGLRLLMSALAASGRAPEAVQAFEEFAHRLNAELELEPVPETRAFVEALRSGKVAGRASKRASLVAGPAEAAPGPPPGRGSIARPGRWVAAGVTMFAVVAVAAAAARGWRSEGALVPDRVIVDVFQNQSGDPALDPIGRMAADWITQGLSRTGLLEVIDPATALLLAGDVGDLHDAVRIRELAGAARAGIVVSGSFYSSGDSILFQARIADVAGGRLHAAVGPLATPRTDPLAGIERLRDRVLGGLAMRFDARVASLTVPSDPPPTYAAYREYIRGLEIHLAGERRQDAIAHFARAAELDTTFMLPLVWATWAHYNAGRPARRDSLLQLLARSEARLGRLERYTLDYWQAGDLEGRLRVARAAAALAPGSNWTYNVGFLAVHTGRPRLAIEALETMQPDRGWVRDHVAYWLTLSRAHHLEGDHERELAVLARGSARHPDRSSLRARRIQALAALGRVEELTRLIEEDAAGSADPVQRRRQLTRTAAWELLAHGHDGAGGSMLEAVAASWSDRPLAEPEPERIGFRATGGAAASDTARGRRQMRLMAMVHDLAMVGRLSEARALAEELTSRPDAVQHLMAEEVRSDEVLFSNVLVHALLGVTAAMQGDVVEAERILAWLIEAPASERTRWANHFHAARLAARLGRDAEAVDLIRRAIALNRENTVHNLFHQAHEHPDFNSLRDYPPFQSLMRRRD